MWIEEVKDKTKVYVWVILSMIKSPKQSQHTESGNHKGRL